MKSEHIPIVFRCLLEKCVVDFREGAVELHSRIPHEWGKGVYLSASSLAQIAHVRLEHVQRIRCTKELFKFLPNLSAEELKICADYTGLEKRFQEEVIDCLIGIAKLAGSKDSLWKKL